MNIKSVKLTIILMFNLIFITILSSLLPKTGDHVNRFGDLGMFISIGFIFIMYLIPVLLWKYKFSKIFISIINGIGIISTFSTMILMLGVMVPLLGNEFFNWLLFVLHEFLCLSFLCLSGYWYYFVFNKIKLLD